MFWSSVGNATPKCFKNAALPLKPATAGGGNGQPCSLPSPHAARKGGPYAWGRDARRQPCKDSPHQRGCLSVVLAPGVDTVASTAMDEDTQMGGDSQASAQDRSTWENTALHGHGVFFSCSWIRLLLACQDASPWARPMRIHQLSDINNQYPPLIYIYIFICLFIWTDSGFMPMHVSTDMSRTCARGSCLGNSLANSSDIAVPFHLAIRAFIVGNLLGCAAAMWTRHCCNAGHSSDHLTVPNPKSAGFPLNLCQQGSPILTEIIKYRSVFWRHSLKLEMPSCISRHVHITDRSSVLKARRVHQNTEIFISRQWISKIIDADLDPPGSNSVVNFVGTVGEWTSWKSLWGQFLVFLSKILHSSLQSRQKVLWRKSGVGFHKAKIQHKRF